MLRSAGPHTLLATDHACSQLQVHGTQHDQMALHCFAGADAAVVRRTQAALSAAGEPAVHFTARFALASRLSALLTVVLGAVMSLLAKSAWGRGLLLRWGQAGRLWWWGCCCLQL